MNTRTPKTKPNSIISERKPAATLNENYKSLPISWRIGHIDFDNEWGLKAIKGKVKFNYSEKLYEEVFAAQNDEIDKKLNSLKGRDFEDLHSFMTLVQDGLSGPIPNNVTCCIIKEFVHIYFWDKIYPKIQTVEQATWHSIESATHGKNGKSNSHYISVGELSRSSQKRLEEIGFGEYDQIYSLRPSGGKLRFFGFKEFNCLNIIWIDPDHGVWDDDK